VEDGWGEGREGIRERGLEFYKKYTNNN